MIRALTYARKLMLPVATSARTVRLRRVGVFLLRMSYFGKLSSIFSGRQNGCASTTPALLVCVYVCAVVAARFPVPLRRSLLTCVRLSLSAPESVLLILSFHHRLLHLFPYRKLTSLLPSAPYRFVL